MHLLPLASLCIAEERSFFPSSPFLLHLHFQVHSQGKAKLRCGGSGGKTAPARQHVEEQSLGFVLRRFPRTLLGEQGLCSANFPLSHADLPCRDGVPTQQESHFRGWCHWGDCLWTSPSVHKELKDLYTFTLLERLVSLLLLMVQLRI